MAQQASPEPRPELVTGVAGGFAPRPGLEILAPG